MSMFSVDAAQVHSATQSAQATIGRIQGEVSALLAQLTGLESSWTGQAASAFQGAVQQWKATQAQVEQSLASLSHALGVAGTQYVDAELANARLFIR
ncbi:MAG TPA: WXG100 family type VII secretion target [Candidatus Lumbricidophila sp.]|nr:WXG100 family type VII secretion target [Candidatus Lumbricidophila sp.]